MTRNLMFSSVLRTAAVATFLCSVTVHGAPSDAALEHARQLLKQTILIDGHNDLPWALRTDEHARGDVSAYDLNKRTRGHTDLARLREGGVGAQFWSVYVPGDLASGSARTQLEQLDLAKRMIERYPDTLQFARSVADIRAAHQAGRIASLLGMEGGAVIENSLGALRAYYDLGARYLTLTHNTHTDWADAATQMPPRHHGLSAFGEEVVREMNRLGMLVDLSHVSPETMAQALRVSRAPVIFSHSSARALVDVPRNVPDDILRKLPANGGVVMVAFVSSFVDSEVARVAAPAYEEFIARSQAARSDDERERLYQEIIGGMKTPETSIARVADHIEHIRAVAGVDHIGIGADYDGNELWPRGLQDVSTYPRLFAELIRRGWSDADLKKLAGENVLRAMERAEAVAAELQKTTAASTMQFEE